MKSFLSKLSGVEKELSIDYGKFSLFGVFLREDALEKWDLLVAAPWIQKDKQKALQTIASKIQRILSKEELLSLSRIVIIDESNPDLKKLQKLFQVEHSNVELENCSFSGLQIKRAHIFTSLETSRELAGKSR